ncbi:Hypothetical protein, putative [Bodo saltans]|uniref:Bifunctional lysine-specific demethylase and histidyl-hydroxylase n=1 Tax=Bodo saltans TaxID=75058 RepID=A0A0S4JDQ0_BODSA|nr:Hypothetical protein, putative [Bodo saltans]|eukprot:CUG89693.1 Hypothetical protein, putative [Bodo saltans]
MILVIRQTEMCFHFGLVLTSREGREKNKGQSPPRGFQQQCTCNTHSGLSRFQDHIMITTSTVVICVVVLVMMASTEVLGSAHVDSSLASLSTTSFLGEEYAVSILLPGSISKQPHSTSLRSSDKEVTPPTTKLDSNNEGIGDANDVSTQSVASLISNDYFFEQCWEKNACVLRPLKKASLSSAQPFSAWLPNGMKGVEAMLSNVSGSWLLEEISISKLDKCRRTPEAAGCLWGDGSTLPASYFDGPSGAQSLQSIRGSVAVQDDVVVGDTMKKSLAEEQLLSYVRERRGIRRTRSFVGSDALIRGEEWRAFADDTNQTLFVRDADAKLKGLFELGGRIQEMFENPRHYLPGSPRSPKRMHKNKKNELQGSLFSRGGGVEVGVSLYYTPPHTQSTVPPHIDTMDVMALQVQGCKEWSLRVPHADSFLPPTPVVLPLSRDHLHTSSLRGGSGTGSNTKATTTVTICPGDVLYLPRGMVHNTSTSPAITSYLPVDIDQLHRQLNESMGDGSSLHISIGIETSPVFTMNSFLIWMGARGEVSGPVQPADAAAASSNAISSGLWAGVPVKDRSFVKRCAARALLYALRTRVQSLRRGFVVPVALLQTPTTDSKHDDQHDRVASYLTRSIDAAHADARDFLITANHHVGKKRWVRLVQDTLGSTAVLKQSIDAWWPAENVAAARYDMSVVMGLLSTTMLDNIQRLLDTAPAADAATPSRQCDGVEHISGSNNCAVGDGQTPTVAETIANELLLWVFTVPSVAEDPTSVWATWLDDGMQKSHEERLAFAEWTWINYQLLTAAHSDN